MGERLLDETMAEDLFVRFAHRSIELDLLMAAKRHAPPFATRQRTCGFDRSRNVSRDLPLKRYAIPVRGRSSSRQAMEPAHKPKASCPACVGGVHFHGDRNILGACAHKNHNSCSRLHHLDWTHRAFLALFHRGPRGGELFKAAPVEAVRDSDPFWSARSHNFGPASDRAFFGKNFVRSRTP